MVNKIIFTFISTSWIWVVYGIEQEWTLPCSNPILSAVVLILAPVLFTLLWLAVAGNVLSVDNINGGCQDIEESQNDFLADYLGYFFIGIGVEDVGILFLMYFIIYIFTFTSQSKLFNPLLLLLGYKYYNITTLEGTKLFLISRKSFRNASEVDLNGLRRINNMSYIDVMR